MQRYHMSLLEKYPELAKEWDNEKNGKAATMVTPGIRGKAWWICPKGHSYQSTISHRLNGCNCPVCSNRKVLPGYNDLATTHPALLKEWMYDKNEFHPEDVPAGTPRKAWWKCNTCGYEWETSILNRTRVNSGCPSCGGHVAHPGVNDLATTNPELIKEWDYERNKGILPSDIKAYSNHKYWWICPNGHSYKTVAAHRASGRGCPYCAGQKVWPGFNDLESQKPELAKEWNYEKNNPLKPSDFTVGSGKKVWWICDKGHEWIASIDNRVKKRGCPICDQEHKTSFPEQAIYFYLKQYFPDALNGDKSTIGMELDIYIPSVKIAVEYDGVAYHDGERAQDREKRKNDLCIENGILLIRIREDDTEYNDCATCIKRKNFHSLPDLDRVIRELFTAISNNITPDIDTKRDFNEIQKQYVISEKQASLEALFPEIARQWHPTKNGSTTPSMIKAHSNRKYWWLCDEGHEWEAVVGSRTGNQRTGCPYCRKQKILAGFNDLATVYPDIAAEWDYEKNIITPQEVTAHANKKVWWICSQGHSYQKAICSRSNGGGCPICSNRKIKKDFNSLSATHPHLVAEWDYEKNAPLTPSDCVAGSAKKVWWKCQACGNEWQTVIHNRAKGHGCPKCAAAYLSKKSSKAEQSVNDLATTHPGLAQDWNYDRNNGMLPSDIKAGSNKKIWWKCHLCGHEWKAIVANRKKGRGCPNCYSIRRRGKNMA